MTCNERIAVDGAALAIIEHGEQWLHVETMPETLRCTRLESLQPGVDPVTEALHAEQLGFDVLTLHGYALHGSNPSFDMILCRLSCLGRRGNSEERLRSHTRNRGPMPHFANDISFRQQLLVGKIDRVARNSELVGKIDRVAGNLVPVASCPVRIARRNRS